MGRPKKTLQDCQELAAAKGGKCISLEYVNSRNNLLWECLKGHQWKASYDNVLQDHWCPECVGCKKHTIKNCKDLASTKEGKCLSIVYVNNQTKLLWECKFGHKWAAIYDNVLHGSWCPECAKQNRIKTNIERYGAENPFQNKKVKQKIKQTNLIRFGVEYPMHSKEIQDKVAKSSNNSGIVLHWKTKEGLVWRASYEKKTLIYFNEIKKEFLWQPQIFTLPDGRTYRPDLYLIDQNLWVEIKGYMRKDAQEKWDWFYENYPNSELWNEKKLKELGIL